MLRRLLRSIFRGPEAVVSGTPEFPTPRDVYRHFLDPERFAKAREDWVSFADADEPNVLMQVGFNGDSYEMNMPGKGHQPIDRLRQDGFEAPES